MTVINQNIFKVFQNELNKQNYVPGNGPITSLLKTDHEYHKACGSNINLFRKLLTNSTQFPNYIFPNYYCQTGYTIYDNKTDSKTIGNKDSINNVKWYDCSNELLLNGNETILSLTSKRGNKESIQFTFGYNKSNLNNIAIKVAELGCDKAKHDTQPSSLVGNISHKIYTTILYIHTTN